jgi:putative transposase
MADDQSMTVRAAASKPLAEEHADVLREAVQVMLRGVMEAEVSAAAGADWYERSDERVAQRNGYRGREWDTRVGTVELSIPRLRTGSYFPSFLERRGGGRSRRWWRWCRRRISTAFRPARWSDWWSSWGSAA